MGVNRFAALFLILMVSVVVGPIVGEANSLEDLQLLYYADKGTLGPVQLGLGAKIIPVEISKGRTDLLYNGVYFEQVGADANRRPIYRKKARQLNVSLGFVDVIYRQDGLFDLINLTAMGNQSKVEILSNLGTIEQPFFSKTAETTVSGSANRMSYGDLNSDGANDLIISQNVSVAGDPEMSSANWWWWPPYAPGIGLGKGYDQGTWCGDKPLGQIVFYKNEKKTCNPSFAEGVLLKTEDGDVIQSPYYYATPLIYDLNGDGRADLLIGYGLDQIYFYENLYTDKDGIPVFAEGKTMVHADYNGGKLRYAGILFSLRAADLDGDGRDELVAGTNDGYGVALTMKKGKIVDEYVLGGEGFPVAVLSLACPTFGDLTGNGLYDLVSGDAGGFITLFENLGTSSSAKFDSGKQLTAGGHTIQIKAGPSGSIQGPGEAMWGYVSPVLYDWDGDGLLDLLVSDIMGRNLFYRNIGDTGHPEFNEPVSLKIEDKDLITRWRCKPAVLGLNDTNYYLTVDEYGYLAIYEQITEQVVRNKQWLYYDHNETMPIKLDGEAGAEGRIKLTVFDWTGNGVWDIVFGCNRCMPLDYFCGPDDPKASLYLLENVGDNQNPRFKPVQQITYLGSPIQKGIHECSPVTVDLDGDGIEELVVGDERGLFMVYDKQFLSTKELARNTAQVLFDNKNTLKTILIIGSNCSHDQIVTDLNLFTKGLYGATIRWDSTDPSVVSLCGTVNRPRQGVKKVKLTAFIEYEGKRTSTELVVTVLGLDS